LDEQSPANPVSTFGVSKLEAEKAILAMRSDSFEPVVARAASMFGCSPRMRFDLAVNHMVATAMRQGYIHVFGGGNQWRPFIHVRDAARAIVLMLEAPAAKVSGEIFNVGSDVFNSRISDLARRVAGFFPGVQLHVAQDDDDRRNYRVQFSKIHDRLGFSCEYSINEGIREVRDKLNEADMDPFAKVNLNIERMKQLLNTPVEEGGEPVAARFIPLAKPVLGPEEEAAVIEAIRTGWLTSGPHLQTFERMFADTVSAPHAVAVASCTAALHLCLVHLGVQPGDEVVTTPLTWASVGNTILNMGAKVVFTDIQPGTLNMDPASLERVITDRTKAIMPVHMAGHPCDLDEIRAAAAKRGVPVIEDAAHAMGAAYKGIPIGNYGDYTCFSFYAIKNITTMEGGAITVKDPEAAARLRVLASNGMDATAWQRYGRSAVAAPPEVVTPGYKYLMGNISATMGIEQLKKLPTFNAARNRLAKMYHFALDNLDEIQMLTVEEHVRHAWHLFIIRLNLSQLRRSRNEIAHALRRENVGTGFHFYGLHLHEYYRDVLGMKPGDLPEATAASNEVLSLPLYPSMSDKNVHEVVAALKKVIAHAK
jgi:dTDP-4-amino-4,6-dideoxygalactose transaminase